MNFKFVHSVKNISLLCVLLTFTTAFADNAKTWEVEGGARAWFSSGTDGAPQPLLNNPPTPTVLASRLNFENLNAYSGEVYGRLDHISKWFVKGYVGAGGITSGALYDEDFPAGPVYSRTYSSASGYLSYLTFDIGRNLIKTPDAKMGVFLGYNYYSQTIPSTGCRQVAGSTVCADFLLPSTIPAVTEEDRYDSLRLGLTSQFLLSDRLQLTTESAYIPIVGFHGMDNHNARALLGPEAADQGDGMMLEGVLNYKLTNYWDIGLGGRYWAWNMRNGTVEFDFLNDPASAFVEPARFNTERFGVFVQGNYHWDDRSALALYSPDPINWKGAYFSGYLGGGWGDDHWSDPFTSTSNGSFINKAGFGNATHATGPLGGLELNYNWQKNAWVYGASIDGTATNIRGEYTCFSGLGGLNCQRIVNSLGTITGRFGYAYNRSLFYAKAGPAWSNTTYKLDGNTSALSLGTGTTIVHQWGWTAGAGIEHALTDHWISSVEYDFINMPSTVVDFATVDTVNAQTIRIRQALNLIKVGIKYKF